MKVLLVHPGKQHSFETAKALKDAGILHKYVTTVYDRPNSFTSKFKKLLKGKNLKKANTRNCSFLEDNDVIQIYELWGLFILLISKIPFLSKLYFHLNIALSNHFADKAAQIAIKEHVDAIIVYDGISRKGLEYIKKKAPQIVTIMDVSISMRPFMQTVFEKDMAEYHHSGFYKEEKYLNNKCYMRTIERELKYVDYFFAPSEIVIQSLIYCGVTKEKIIKVPYGVNISLFKFNLKKIQKTNPLHLIFVGQLSYRKGIHHLLNVVSHFSPDEVQLSLAGSYNHNSLLVNNFLNKPNIHFLGFITRDILSQKLQEADVFVLPSLGEGMAMVILEAMGTGTPVIVSDMSGGNDAVKNKKNGIICKAGSEESLKESIQWYIKNKEKIPEMSIEAHKTALNYTWEHYHKTYGEQIINILKK